MIKIYINMQLEYLQSEIRPKIDMEFVYEIAKKYYPGTLKILKNKLVDTITKEEEKGVNSKEMKVFNELKNILYIVYGLFTDNGSVVYEMEYKFDVELPK